MFRLFFHCLASRRYEYLAATTVVAVVVAVLVVQKSLTISAEKRIHDLAHHLGKNMLVVPADTDLAQFYSLRYDDTTMPDTYPKQLRSSKVGRHIKAVEARLYGNVEVEDVPLVLVGQNDIFRRRALARAPSSSVGKKHDPRCVMGDEAARRVGVSEGSGITIGGTELDVVRVTRSLPDGLEQAAFIDLATAQRVLRKPGAINAMRLGGCWCSVDVPALATQVEHQLPGTRAITVAGVVRSQTGTISVVKRYSKVLYGTVIFSMAGIIVALIVLQARRQTKEIGLLLAVGASPSAIASMFIGMAGLVGVVGGIGGYLLGYPLTGYAASRFLGESLPVAEGLFLPILILASLVSLISALAPAWHAASLDPTTVLREV